MRDLYYTIKRKLMRLRCAVLDKHNHKMGVPDKNGLPGGCLWCRKPIKEWKVGL